MENNSDEDSEQRLTALNLVCLTGNLVPEDAIENLIRAVLLLRDGLTLISLLKFSGE